MCKNGILGGMFDLDGDGEMSAFESALEYQFLQEVVLCDDEEDYDEFDDDYEDDL